MVQRIRSDPVELSDVLFTPSRQIFELMNPRVGKGTPGRRRQLDRELGVRFGFSGAQIRLFQQCILNRVAKDANRERLLKQNRAVGGDTLIFDDIRGIS